MFYKKEFTVCIVDDYSSIGKNNKGRVEIKVIFLMKDLLIFFR